MTFLFLSNCFNNYSKLHLISTIRLTIYYVHCDAPTTLRYKISLTSNFLLHFHRDVSTSTSRRAFSLGVCVSIENVWLGGHFLCCPHHPCSSLDPCEGRMPLCAWWWSASRCPYRGCSIQQDRLSWGGNTEVGLYQPHHAWGLFFMLGKLSRYRNILIITLLVYDMIMPFSPLKIFFLNFFVIMLIVRTPISCLTGGRLTYGSINFSRVFHSFLIILFN